MTATGVPLTDRLRAHLQASVNPDGGWPYSHGKQSRLEPTAWSVLALRAHPSSSALVDRGIARLRSWQQPGGFPAEPGLPPSATFSAVVLLAWLADGDRARALAEPAGRLASAIGRAKGVTLENSPSQRQDNSIPGWAWLDGDFSWVEPTAWCLLALKVARRRGLNVDGVRIEAAERLLADRVCTGGGWNYGNSNMLGAELAAYVPTTAIALLALHDLRDRPFVATSLARLSSFWRSEPAGLALSLVKLALRRYGVAAEGVDEALAEAYQRSAFLDNLATVALASVALASEADGLEPFAY